MYPLYPSCTFCTLHVPFGSFLYPLHPSFTLCTLLLPFVPSFTLCSLLQGTRSPCVGQLAFWYEAAQLLFVWLCDIIELLGVENPSFHVVIDIVGLHLELQGRVRAGVDGLPLCFYRQARRTTATGVSRRSLLVARLWCAVGHSYLWVLRPLPTDGPVCSRNASKHWSCCRLHGAAELCHGSSCLGISLISQYSELHAHLHPPLETSRFGSILDYLVCSGGCLRQQSL